jgi:Leucine-rich repeat (LRR) protein
LREKLRRLGLSTVGKKDELVERYMARDELIANGLEDFSRKRKLDQDLRSPNGRPKKKMKRKKKKKGDQSLDASEVIDGLAITSSDEAQFDLLRIQPIFERPRRLPIVAIPEPSTTLELSEDQLRSLQSSTSYHYYHKDPFEHITLAQNNNHDNDEESDDIIKDKTLKKVICEHLGISIDDNKFEKKIEKLNIIQSQEAEEDTREEEEEKQKLTPSRRKRRGRPKKSQQEKQAPLNKRQITTIEGIENCVSLKKVIIASHLIDNLEPLTHLKQLEQMWFSHNRISVLPQSMSSLADCLRVINLSFNSIQDISPLKELVHLIYLNLSYNKRIQDISSLASLPILEELDLSGNSLDDDSLECMKDFKSLSTLCTLRLNLNKISNLHHFESFEKLKELSLNCNQVQDISPLLELHRLREVDMQDNPPLLTTLALVREGKLSGDNDSEIGKSNADVLQTLQFSHIRIVV